MAIIEYDNHEFRVDSDLLLKTELEQEAKPEPEPEERHEIPEMCWDSLAHDFSANAARWALDQACVQSFAAVNGVVVEQVGKAEVAPIHLQVQTTKEFKVGELVLVLHLGRFNSTIFF